MTSPTSRSFAGKPFTVASTIRVMKRSSRSSLPQMNSAASPANTSCPKARTLGVYSIQVVKLDGDKIVHYYGGSNFRVEEYKKPEFEVKVEGPKEPVKLGDKVTATIEAKYYFGAPVVNAVVKYKVMRESYRAAGIP